MASTVVNGLIFWENYMDDSYFKAELIKQFRLAEPDYQTYAHSDTCKEVPSHGDKVPGDETETIEISDSDEETDSDTEVSAEGSQDFHISLCEKDEKKERLIDLFNC